MNAISSNQCVIAVHDVTPRYEDEVAHLCDTLFSRVGASFTAAVVPDWHGRYPLLAAPRFCERLAGYGCEVALHGFTHRASRLSVTGILTGGADELNRAHPAEIARCLSAGQQIIHRAFGKTARTLVPPAWGFPRSGGTALRDAGLVQVQRYHRLDRLNGAPIPLRTYSWDCGRLSILGWIGHLWGGVQSRLPSAGYPCLVFHPRDVQTGFLRLGIGVLARLLAAGFEPVSLDHFAKEAR